MEKQRVALQSRTLTWIGLEIRTQLAAVFQKQRNAAIAMLDIFEARVGAHYGTKYPMMRIMGNLAETTLITGFALQEHASHVQLDFIAMAT